MLKLHTFVLSILLFIQPIVMIAQTNCSGGMAGSYPCDAVDLQSFINKTTLGTSGRVNDIWGWTDPLNGNEYAIIGLENGTAFVNITNSTSPINLGRLPTHSGNSLWRDIKVIGNYAYIVSEASGHGIQVFDLTRLRSVSSPPVTFTEDGHAPEISNAHNIVSFEERGYIVAVGSNMASGGLVFFDVNSNPTNPALVGSFSSDGYTHDAICFVYRGPDKDYIGRDICIGFNENTNTIVDATDKTNIVQLSRTPYAGSRYTHQGWITDDHKYMLVNDELDESNNGHNTRTYIFDISDLGNPVFMGYHEHPFAAIDHNLYIKGRYAYLSNYTSGLRVLDISNIASASLTEVAGFDTYPSNNNDNYNGTWSNYPYFKSGNVIVSGIQEGLFVLKPNIPHFDFDLQSDGIIRLCPGGTANITLDVDVFAGFSETINLSLSGLDPSLTATLASSTVSGGGQVTITVTATDTGGQPVCAGNYCVLLTGAGSSANSEQSIALGIIIDETFPGCMTISNCPSCDDGIQNQDEIGIDCGGICSTVCPTCDDGIQNQDETGIDCGGICLNICPTCNDGIQNQDEIGIDCGGINCFACLGTCGNSLYINCNSSTTGDNADGFNIYQAYNGTFSLLPYSANELVYTFTVAVGGLVNIDLTGLTANLDMFLYGSCDPSTAPLGSSKLLGTNPESISATLAAGTYYLFIDATRNGTSPFNLSISCPSGNCSDGVQNENETGVDCGGSTCSACVTSVEVLPKVFLQGPFNGTDMTAAINTMLPTTEPYTALGYTHIGGGGEMASASILGMPDIVDWVVVELRDKTNSANVIATCAALLKRDGTIVSHTDGTSAVQLQTVPDDYYVAVRHRNHLGMMTTNTFYID